MNVIINQTQTEIQKRIDKTNQLCQTFKDSYSGYSSNAKEWGLMIVLGIIFVAFITAIVNCDTILSKLGSQGMSRDMLFLRLAFAGSLAYITLHIIKKYLQIRNISKIDSLVASVKGIGAYLQEKLNNITKISSDVEKIVLGNANNKLTSQRNVDAEIKRYASLENTYINPDANLLTAFIKLLHTICGIIFVVLIVYVFMPLVTAKWIGYMSTIYPLIFVFGYYLTQKVFITAFSLNIKNKILDWFSAVSIIGLLFYQIVSTAETSLLFFFIIPPIVALACVWFIAVINRVGKKYGLFIGLSYFPILLTVTFLKLGPAYLWIPLIIDALLVIWVTIYQKDLFEDKWWILSVLFFILAGVLLIMTGGIFTHGTLGNSITILVFLCIIYAFILGYTSDNIQAPAILSSVVVIMMICYSSWMINKASGPLYILILITTFLCYLLSCGIAVKKAIIENYVELNIRNVVSVALVLVAAILLYLADRAAIPKDQSLVGCTVFTVICAAIYTYILVGESLTARIIWTIIVNLLSFSLLSSVLSNYGGTLCGVLAISTVLCYSVGCLLPLFNKR